MDFHNAHLNVFSPGEVVVVFRSNGTKTFGVVENIHAAVGCNAFFFVSALLLFA